MKCCKCGKNFDENLGICPFCGTEISDFVITEEVDNHKMGNDSTVGAPKPRKKSRILALSVLLPVLCAMFMGMYFLISSVILSDARTYSEEEISEICDVLDYSALSATLDYYSESIAESYLHDADSDGRKELFITSYNDVYEDRPVVFAFDTVDNGTMATATHLGAAGDVCISSEFSNDFCLKWGYYSTGYSEVHYEEWTNNGWNEITDTINPPIEIKEIEEARNKFEATIKEISESPDIGKVSHYQLMSKYYNAKNHEDIVEAYNEHLIEWWGQNYKYIKEDIDEDGKNEYAFIISNFGKHWADNLTTTGTDGILMENFIEGLEEIGTICIYADADKNGIVFHTFFTDKSVDVYTLENQYEGDNIKLSWQDGELLIKIIKGKEIITENFFCSGVKFSKENYEADKDAFNTVSELYTKYLKNHLYKEVLVKYVDICEAPGDELVCVCTDSDIERVNVYAIYCGRIITLYEQDYGQTGAVYLAEKDGKMMLLNYIQRVYGNQLFPAGSGNRRTGNDYRYWFTGFDENYCAYECDMQYLLLYDDETPTAKDNEFFVKLNDYLDIATVCVDRYELMGYSVMPNIQTDYSQTETGKYLSISNCNLNKKGKVHVNEDSWLNFREGPAITYNKILTNSADSESFVKQMNGSSVTVIDTNNTGDAENPIWVKIQIKYSDQTLIGYSSQKYIEISDIKHIEVGETFTVEASTNDDGLHWSSNDDNILSIDGSTGKVTGKNKGLVLVSVESESGLTDSCLIMVN